MLKKILKDTGRTEMPNRFWIYIVILVSLGFSSCAKRNTAYQDEEWLSLERQLPVVGNPLDIKIDDNYIYVAQDQGGISVIRRSDYNNNWITKLKAADGSQANLGRIKHISVVPELNRMFFVETSATDRIVIVNTSDPDTLEYVLEIVGGTGGITQLESSVIPNPTDLYTMNIGYCTAGGFKYDRFDGNVLSNNIYSITPPANATGYAMNDDYILIAAGQRGLFIYNRATQQYVSELVLPGEAQKVVLNGDLALVACRQGGLSIVDFSNPAMPELLSNYATSSFATDVANSGTKVAVSAGTSGVYLFDINDPDDPQLLQRLSSCGYANTVKFMGNQLIVAARDQGILIYNIK